MKRIKKFCHIHDTPEGQVLFMVTNNTEQTAYQVQATFMWEELEMSVSMTNEDMTEEHAIEILETMDYDKYTKYALEEIDKVLEMGGLSRTMPESSKPDIPDTSGMEPSVKGEDFRMKVGDITGDDTTKFYEAQAGSNPSLKEVIGIKDRDKTLEVLKGFIERGKASISDAQRYHKLGYNRATKIFQQLGQLGLICEAKNGNESVIDMKQFKELEERSFDI